MIARTTDSRKLLGEEASVPTYSKNPYTVVVSNDGLIQVKPGDCLSAYSWAIYGNYTTLDVFARPGANGQPAPIVNKDLIYSGETLIHLPDYQKSKGPAKNGGQVSIGTPAGTVGIPLGSTTAPAAPTVRITTLYKSTLDKGGWVIKTKVGGVLSAGQEVVLLVGTTTDFVFLQSREYGLGQMESLLEIFAYSNLWSQPVSCRAAVVERIPWTPSQPVPDGARLMRTFGGFSRYPIVYALRILSQSSSRTVQAPVRPIATCPFGREMLLRIGQIQPRLPFIKIGNDFAGSWLTQPIAGRNYLKRGFDSDGSSNFVTEQTYNGMDCTSYMLAGFGMDLCVAGLYADDIVDHLPVRNIGQERIGGTAEVQAFFATNQTGNYVVFHHTHFVAVIDGIVREFSEGSGGYRETPIGQHTFPVTSAENSKWSIRSF